MTEQEREEFRQFNGRLIEELCEKSIAMTDKFLKPERTVAGVPKSQWDVMERQRDYHE